MPPSRSGNAVGAPDIREVRLRVLLRARRLRLRQQELYANDIAWPYFVTLLYGRPNRLTSLGTSDNTQNCGPSRIVS